MRLLSLDYDPVFGGDETVRAAFASDISCFDFDVVIWDLAFTLKSYISQWSPSYYMNAPALSDDESVRLVRDLERRRAEFSEFLRSGRTLVVIVQPPQQCYVATGEQTYSGTGRNRVTTRMVESKDVWSALPLDDVEVERGSGTRVEILSGGPISQFLKKHKERMHYAAIVNHERLTPIARVSGTSRVVSAAAKWEGGGNLILLPRLDLQFRQVVSDDDLEEAEASEDDDDTETQEWVDEAPQVQIDLLAAVSDLGGVSSIARPGWASQFATNEQIENRSRVAEQQRIVEEARNELSRLETLADEVDRKSQLFLGSGRALELEVRAVLELLGGQVEEPEPGRADWHVRFPERTAVVEVKGVSKSAAEKNAAQLEKWVSTAVENGLEIPKGILVVNTWRELPFDQRTEADFPEQMLKFSSDREHCLVTGLQLFLMRREVESGALPQADARALLLGTIGRLEQFRDWAAAFEEISDQAAEEK